MIGVLRRVPITRSLITFRHCPFVPLYPLPTQPLPLITALLASVSVPEFVLYPTYGLIVAF